MIVDENTGPGTEIWVAEPLPSLRVTTRMEHRYFNSGQIQPVRDVEVIDISNDQEDNERHSAGLYATAHPSPQEPCGVIGMEIADDLEEKEQKTLTSHCPSSTQNSSISVSSSIPSATRDPSSTEALCLTPQASGTSLIGASSCSFSCGTPQGSTERLFASPSCSCGVQQASRLVNMDRTRSTLSMDHGDKAGIDAGVSKPRTVEAGEVTEKEVEVGKPVATIKPMEVELVGRSKSSMRSQRRKERRRELVRRVPPNRSSSTRSVAVDAKVDADADADVAAELPVERPKRGREEDPANTTPGLSPEAKRRNSTEIQVTDPAFFNFIRKGYASGTMWRSSRRVAVEY